MNWHTLGEETIDLLRRYLMLDTTNPPGNETTGARFLEDVLRHDSIASETAESAPGRGNLVARLRGDGSLGGIVLNVIPPEATADIDCRMLRGDDPDEIVSWMRAAIADERVEVSLLNPPPKIPNSSPPDTELYKALGEALRRRAPGVVVAPDILVGFTDNWVFRNCGLHGYGFSPFILGDEEWRRVHGNDERISLENLREGVRCHTEMLLEMAAA